MEEINRNIVKHLEAHEKRAKLAKEIERREFYNKHAPFPIYDTEIINDLKQLIMVTRKENYNHVPVTYCRTCLSLHIKDVTFPRSDGTEPVEDQKPEALVGYCVPCGNTDLAEVQLSEWEEMYEEKYEEKFLKGE